MRLWLAGLLGGFGIAGVAIALHEPTLRVAGLEASDTSTGGATASASAGALIDISAQGVLTFLENGLLKH